MREPARERWKIAVEEHVALPAGPDAELLELMDRSAIERMILSPGGTGVQAEPDRARAVAAAATANDRLAEIVAARPDRFSAFAVLPLQDPAAAADELERAVAELGCCGALVNGYTSCDGGADGRYYDEPAFDVVWERVEALGVPFYLHPRDPLPSQQRIYAGRPELLGAPWAYGAETAGHALRLILGGLFDRFPGVRVVLGHLGEMLPFAIGRTASRLQGRDLGLRRPVDAYFRDHFHVTTSGHFTTSALTAAIAELGSERVLFALDHPYADSAAGDRWFDALALEPEVRERIGRGNALRLFGLDRDGRASQPTTGHIGGPQ